MTQWTIKEPAAHRHGAINKFFQDKISGFNARNATHEETAIRSQATAFLPTDQNGVFHPTIWLAAYVGDDMVGAINTAISYPMVLDIARSGHPDYARGFAQERRVIAGLAVREDMRGQGIGAALLDANQAAAAAQGVSVLVGFMDEDNGYPNFYKNNGFTIEARNSPLPRLGEFPINEGHSPYMAGHWFHRTI